MVTLRAIEREDLTCLRNWRNELIDNFRQHKFLNMRDQDLWWKRVTDDPRTEMFGICYTTLLIGVCGLCYIDWVSRHAEVSVYIGDPEHRGIGSALEALMALRDKAFNEFNLHRLWAEIYGFNQASVRLFERAGYSHEGTLKESHFAKGRYWDSLIYGLVNPA